MKKTKVGIIGGGASGIAAAIVAAQKGADVTLIEKNDRVGKKILATGNGKCNLGNSAFDVSAYRSDDREALSKLLSGFSTEDVLTFFDGLGLLIKNKNGYLYPECEQASAVVDVLRFALERYHIKIHTCCKVYKIEPHGVFFRVHMQNDDRHLQETFDKIILACGSSAGIKNTADVNSLDLLHKLGMQYHDFLPALVQLRCTEPFFKALAGVRIQAGVTLFVGKQTYYEIGELQLTEYGISGIPVFQLSRYASKALSTSHKGKTLPVIIDFLPQFDEAEWKEYLLKRRKSIKTDTAEQFFAGTLHKKVLGVLLKECGISYQCNMNRISDEKIMEFAEKSKHFKVSVTAANSCTQAQVCAGGLCLSEINSHFESNKTKGLYVVGEMLDVDGKCGGYNLQWAWLSGMTAGGDAVEGKEL